MKYFKLFFMTLTILSLTACDITYEYNKNTGKNHQRAEECRQRLHLVEMLSYNDCLNRGEKKDICDYQLRMMFSFYECGCNGKEKEGGMDNSGMCGM